MLSYLKMLKVENNGNEFLSGRSDITLFELIKAIWNGRFIIIFSVFLATIFSVVYIALNPAVYQSRGSFIINSNIYGDAPLGGYNAGRQNIQEIQDYYPLLNSEYFKRDIFSKIISENHKISYNINLSKDIRDGVINLQSLSSDPKLAFENAKYYLDNVNSFFKKYKKIDVNNFLISAEEVINSFDGKVNNRLLDKSFDLQYKLSVLNNDKVNIIKVISYPKNESEYFSSNPILILLFGVVMGFLVGTIIVSFFSFRKTE